MDITSKDANYVNRFANHIKSAQTYLIALKRYILVTDYNQHIKAFDWINDMLHCASRGLWDLAMAYDGKADTTLRKLDNLDEELYQYFKKLDKEINSNA